jgi:hypothetical protein
MDVENRRINLRWEKLAAVFAVICILTADRGISASDGRGKPAGEKLEIFDDKSKVIIVNGYSTSFRWPGGISSKNQSLRGNFHICSGQRPVYGELRVDMNLGPAKRSSFI